MICSVTSKQKQNGKEKAAEKALRILFSSNTRISRSVASQTTETSPVPDKDPVTALMEYAQAHNKTVKFETLNKTGPDNQPTFTMVAELDDGRFEAVVGGRLKQLKKKAAIKALNTIEKKTRYFSQRCKLRRSLVASSLGKADSSLNPVVGDLCPPDKNPVSVFMEYAQAKRQTGKFRQVNETGPPHRKRFQFVACLDGEEFPTATGSKNKEAQQNAAILALRSLRDKGLYLVTQSIGMNNNTVLCRTTDDRIAACCQQKFNELVADISEDLRERKVIAAIISIDGLTDQVKVVSLGSGNRCIKGDRLSMHGDVIYDSHAEIIAKRGFRRFLYRSISSFKHGNKETVIQETSKNKFQIRDGITFHLFISTAPCGDGAIFTHNESSGTDDVNCKSHTPIYDNKTQGKLRTKMEKGEGTIPVEDGIVVQSWDGIKRGERLRTMSCSDKICSWNVLGLQGALLSNIMTPVYLKSITLGQLFNNGHLCRAVCCRVENQKDDFSSELPSAYRLNHPDLGKVTAYNVPRYTEKSRQYSINWNIMDGDVEVTDGTTGLRVQTVQGQSTKAPMIPIQDIKAEEILYPIDDGESSRLSKANLYKCYKTICRRIKQTDLLAGNYRDSKQIASSYQCAKNIFKTRFAERGFGKWLSKPMESDLFSE